jgi:hypothetical protein
LFLGEGIETTLAAAMRLPHLDMPMRPAWAAGSGDNLRKLPPLPGVSKLFLLVDYDTKGDEVTNECRRIWLAAGRQAERLRPPQVGMDFNDYVIALESAVTC